MKRLKMPAAFLVKPLLHFPLITYSVCRFLKNKSRNGLREMTVLKFIVKSIDFFFSCCPSTVELSGKTLLGFVQSFLYQYLTGFIHLWRANEFIIRRSEESTVKIPVNNKLNSVSMELSGYLKQYKWSNSLKSFYKRLHLHFRRSGWGLRVSTHIDSLLEVHLQKWTFQGNWTKMNTVLLIYTSFSHTSDIKCFIYQK